ncbi:hypothetical protein [Xanthomonas perforans]|uniref:hypothetical protein n=1 Tax=Xanthomonas perforans TaxID=442694 RepID=UPI0012DB23DD|nr:hypothetical protein [Xanthomonas perforans]
MPTISDVQIRLPFPLNSLTSHLVETLLKMGFSPDHIAVILIELCRRGESSGQDAMDHPRLGAALLNAKAAPKALIEEVEKFYQKLNSMYSVSILWEDVANWIKGIDNSLSEEFMMRIYEDFRNGKITNKSQLSSAIEGLRNQAVGQLSQQSYGQR